MTAHFHAVVWIDHSQAKVFHLGLSGADEVALHPHLPTRHLHHKAGSTGVGHAAPDKAFYAEVIRMDLSTKKPWKLMLRGTALASGICLLAVAILLLGGKPIVSLLFGKAFGQTPTYWMNLQTSYDLKIVEKCIAQKMQQVQPVLLAA